MGKMKCVFFVVFIVLFSSFSSAELFFSQPQAVYSIGDDMRISVFVRPHLPSINFLSIKIVCPSGSTEIYKNSITISSQETREVLINTALSRTIIGSLEGQCYLLGEYGNITGLSQLFKISSEARIEMILYGTPADPGDIIRIKGKAIKSNGKPLYGLAEIYINDSTVPYSTLISNGSFSLNITLPNNIPSGQHKIVVYSYDRDNEGKIMNEGNISDNFFVRSVLRYIEIDATPEIYPNETLSFLIKTFDQAGEIIERDATYTIYTPSGMVFQQAFLKTNKKDIINFDTNSSPGYWKIEARIGDIFSRKHFYIKEFEFVSFDIVNQTLIVKNLGNIPYKKTVEIKIGQNKIFKNIDLNVGQTRRYKISAPTSNYSIKIDDGKNQIEAQNVLLTGNAIRVGELKNNFNLVDYYLLFPLFLILLSVLFITGFYIRKNKKYNQSVIEPKPLTRISFAELYPNDKPYINGTKEIAYAIAIKIKSENAEIKNAIKNAIDYAIPKGAHIYNDDTTQIAILTPSKITNINDLIAINIANTMLSMIQNKGKEINFGIGIVKGEVIVDKPSGKIHAIGNLIPLAKKIANNAFNSLNISENIYRVVMNDIKAEKNAEGDFWNVKKIIDKDSHKSFIDNFLKRQKNN